VAEQFTTAFLTEFRKSPELQECDPYSVVGGMRQAAQMRLQFGPLGHVYLIPFKDKGVYRAQFILGYRGMIELAYRSGHVKSIEANVVREGDEFKFRQGSRPFLDFTPAGPPADREWTHVYALARLMSGGAPFTVLYPDDVEARKKQSKSWRSEFSPWQKWPEQMWEKSAVRDLQRFLPQTSVLAAALEQDEQPAEALDELPDDDA
jgi:recombination protein RecT